MNGHACGRCGVKVHSVVFLESGLRGHVEWTSRGELALVAELPGVRGSSLPHVSDRSPGPRRYRVHRCAGAGPSFSAASFAGKRRPA